MTTNTKLVHQSFQIQYAQEIYQCQLGLGFGDLSELKSARYDFLHPDELHYFHSLTHEKRQFSFLLSRYSAKQLLAHYYDLSSLTSFQIKSGIFQQPLISGLGADANISLSHCQQLSATIIFPPHLLLGIDVECTQPNLTTTLQNQMTQDEKKLINQILGDETPIFSLTLFWTIKESLSKAIKTGLTIPADILAIKAINICTDGWTSHFKYFAQYQAFSFKLDTLICSLVFPKNAALNLDIKSIKNSVENMLMV